MLIARALRSVTPENKGAAYSNFGRPKVDISTPVPVDVKGSFRTDEGIPLFRMRDGAASMTKMPGRTPFGEWTGPLLR